MKQCLHLELYFTDSASKDFNGLELRDELISFGALIKKNDTRTNLPKNFRIFLFKRSGWKSTNYCYSPKDFTDSTSFSSIWTAKLLLSAVMVAVAAQNKAYSTGYDREYTTPVPILKQIDRHNDDGSYSYGYENADGAYKIETKYPTGEVYGKYGYIDDTGKLREVEYGASKRGFEPAGTDVTVAPPTLTQNPEAQRALGPNEEDDGQYREDPGVYYKNDPNFVPKAPSYNSYSRPSFQMSYAPYSAPVQPPYTAPVKPTYAPPQFNDYYNNQINNPIPTPAPRYNYAPQMSYWNPSPPAYPGYNAFQGSPAQNVDIWTGSYTVNYRR